MDNSKLETLMERLRKLEQEASTDSRSAGIHSSGELWRYYDGRSDGLRTAIRMLEQSLKQRSNSERPNR